MKIITSPGLYVWSSFTEKFGSEDIKSAKTVPGFKTLTRHMSDSEIKKELGVEECTLADVAAFLTNPPEGTKDSNWNLFYVAGYVVNVYWRSGHREWDVDAWLLDGGSWYAGWRAFGRNFVNQTLGSDGHLDPLTLGLSEAIARVKEAGYVIYKPV